MIFYTIYFKCEFPIPFVTKTKDEMQIGHMQKQCANQAFENKILVKLLLNVMHSYRIDDSYLESELGKRQK